jgi:1,5-anhydro-D-fructose reductase (1,5-anhydro-D-mannitol-forming)
MRERTGGRVEQPIRVAALGMWHVHGDDYAQAALARPETELVAVWDDDEIRGRAAAARHGVPFTSDLDELLARDDVDAVTVTTSTTTHADVITRAATAGKHIFSEKLLGATGDEAQELLALAESRGIVLTVALPWLSFGFVQQITELVAAGQLGKLTHCRVRLSHDGALTDSLPERFFRPAEAVGGALSDLGAHAVALVQLFLGDRPDRVRAAFASWTGKPAEDNAVAILDYAGSALGVVETGFVSRDAFTLEVDGVDANVRFCMADNRLLHRRSSPSSPTAPARSSSGSRGSARAHQPIPRRGVPWSCRG